MLEPQRRDDLGLDLPFLFNDEDSEPTEPELNLHQPWWRRPRGIAIIAGVLLVALLAGATATVLARRGPKVTYQSSQVTQGNLVVTVSATGPVQGAIYNVNFSGSGKISEIDVSVGQQVTQGQTLAKLDPTSLQDALNQAQAQVNSAQTALDNAITSRNNTAAQTQAQLNSAYDTEQSAISACNAKGDPAGCVQTAEDQYASVQAQVNAQNASAQGQVNSAQAQLNSAQTSLQTAQDNLKNDVLTAPGSGTVAAINGVVGGAPGSSSGSSTGSGSGGSSAFIEIVDLSTLQVDASVNEADIGGVAQGQAATFTVSAYSTRTFHGTVTTISPLGQTTSNVVTYPVTIDVDMQSVQGAKLLPGMTATVSITTAQRIGVLTIPAAAVTFARAAANPASGGFLSRAQVLAAVQQARTMAAQVPTSTSSSANSTFTPSFVLERSSTGTWIVKPIVLGLTNGSVYEVVSGLNQGETVITGETGGTLSTTSSTTSGAPRGAGGFFGGGGGGGRFGGGGGAANP